MFCTKCGNTLPDDARFCTACGAAMAAPAVAPTEAPATADPAAEPVAAPEVTEAVAAPEVVAEAPEAVEVPTEPLAPEAQPNDEQAPVAEESANYAAPSCVPYTEDAPVAPAPKKGKKKLILLIVAAVLALALIVGGVIFAVAYNSPEAKLARAFDRTGEALSEITAKAETFRGILSNLSRLKDGKTVELGIEIEDPSMTAMDISLRVDQDMKNKQLYVDINGSTIEPYNFSIYADQEQLIASVDGLDTNYSLPLENFGEKLYDSDLGLLLEEELDPDVMDILYELDIDLFRTNDFSDIKETCPEEYEAFEDSIVLEKADVPMPCDADCEDVYYITWDMEALGELMAAYYAAYEHNTFGANEVLFTEGSDPEELKEAFTDVELELYVGETDGMLTAFYLEISDEEETHSLAMVLEGKDNIWEDFTLYADDEEEIVGGFTATRNGFALSMTNDGDELLLNFDDADGELTIEENDEEVAILFYSDEDEGMCITYVLPNALVEAELFLSVRPVEQIEKPAEAIDVLSLTEDELYDLYRELMGFFLGY